MKPMNRLAGAMVLALVAALAAGCDSTPTATKDEPMAAAISCTVSTAGAYTLTFTGAGYSAAHPQQTLRAALINNSSGGRVAVCSGVLSGDPLTINFGGVLAASTSYNLNYYVDVNGTGTCNAPPTDHAWQDVIAAGIVNVTINRPHDLIFTDVCATNFAP
jgi:hypothetical protein